MAESIPDPLAEPPPSAPTARGRTVDRSYRALLAVPTLGRLLLAMQIARVAQSMVGVALVLFTLDAYHSPALAGAVTFASTFPGILVSPVAGALLDRRGRVRLIIADYLVSLTALVLIGFLALGHLLPAPLLVLITAVASLTGILSATGLRSLFPMLAPKHLWERVNAIDSNGYLVATILGPPTAAAAVALLGGPTALIVIGASFGLAAASMIGIGDPPTPTSSTGRLLADALDGVRYAWRNPTIRGLGFSISALNVAGGMTTIVVPLIVLRLLHLGEPVVGLMFALSGVAGIASTLLFGRLDTRGREWPMLVIPMVLFAGATALLLVAVHSVDAGIGVALAFLGSSLALAGIFNGPLDIALFTVRQRRTDPAWMGRVFAVSMAFNFSGFPIGAAAAGALAAVSIDAAILLGVVACLAGAVFAATMVPRHVSGFVPAVPSSAGSAPPARGPGEAESG